MSGKGGKSGNRGRGVPLAPEPEPVAATKPVTGGSVNVWATKTQGRSFADAVRSQKAEAAAAAAAAAAAGEGHAAQEPVDENPPLPVVKQEPSSGKNKGRNKGTVSPAAAPVVEHEHVEPPREPTPPAEPEVVAEPVVEEAAPVEPEPVPEPVPVSHDILIAAPTQPILWSSEPIFDPLGARTDSPRKHLNVGISPAKHREPEEEKPVEQAASDIVVVPPHIASKAKDSAVYFQASASSPINRNKIREQELERLIEKTQHEVAETLKERNLVLAKHHDLEREAKRLESRGNEIAVREADIGRREQEIHHRTQDLTRREQELERREADVRRRETDLAAKLHQAPMLQHPPQQQSQQPLGLPAHDDHHPPPMFSHPPQHREQRPAPQQQESWGHSETFHPPPQQRPPMHQQRRPQPQQQFDMGDEYMDHQYDNFQSHFNEDQGGYQGGQGGWGQPYPGQNWGGNQFQHRPPRRGGPVNPMGPPNRMPRQPMGPRGGMGQPPTANWGGSYTQPNYTRNPPMPYQRQPPIPQASAPQAQLDAPGYGPTSDVW